MLSKNRGGAGGMDILWNHTFPSCSDVVVRTLQFVWGNHT